MNKSAYLKDKSQIKINPSVRRKLLTHILPGIFLSCTISLLPAYSQQIITDGQTNTLVNTQGQYTEVTTSTIKNNNAFNSFSKFNVDENNTVNLILPTNTSNLINLVHSDKSFIHGTLNSISQNHIGGNVFFVNPYGLIVGPTGTINVGSLNAVSPTTSFMNSFFDAAGMPNDQSVQTLLNGATPINAEAEIRIDGTINAIQDIRLTSGHVQTAGTISTGAVFQENNLQTGDVVNLNLVENGTNITVDNGHIRIEAQHTIETSGKILSEGNNHKGGGTIDLQAGQDINLNTGTFISTQGKGVDSNGGTVVVLAGHNTSVNPGSEINARGGDLSGDGGFIEVSAKNHVNLNGGNTFAGAKDGTAGTILIDPPTLDLNANDFTDGANKTYTADNTINVANNVIVSSRNITDPTNGNHLTDISEGNSGNLTFSAPNINFNPGSKVYAHANNGFTPGNVTINPTTRLGFDTATVKTGGSTTINGGNITDNGITFNPTSVETGTLTSDFMTPSGTFNVNANNAAVIVGNLDNLSINGGNPNFTDINISSNRDTFVTGNLTATNDINVTSSPPNYWQGTYDDANVHNGTLNAGRDINVTSNSLNAYEGIDIQDSLFNAGRNINLTSHGDVYSARSTHTAVNNINFIAYNSVEVVSNSTLTGINITLDPGNGSVWDGLAGRLVFWDSILNASGTFTVDYGDPGHAGGIGFNPTLINAQTINSNFLIHNSTLSIPNPDNWAGSSIALGNLDKVYFGGGTQLQFTGLTLPWRQSVMIYPNVIIYGPINITSDWVQFYNNPTLTSYGSTQQKNLLVNANGTIDPSSTINATIANNNINVENVAVGNGGSINLTGTLYYNGTIKAATGVANVNMTNNSTNDFTINDVSTTPVTGGQVNINGTIFNANGVYNSTQNVVVNNVPNMGTVQIDNNTGSNILLAGTIQKAAGNVNITNTGGNILAGNTGAVINGQNVNLNAVNGSIGNSYVKVNAETGALTAYGKTHVHIEAPNNLPIDTIISPGDVSLIAGSNILDARSSELPNIYGHNITLNSTNGSLGTSIEDLDLFLNYKSSGGVLNATALNGPINLYQYSGDMILNRTMSKQDVTLGSRNNILDGNVGDSVINVYGHNISLSSVLGSIGTPAEDLDLLLNYGSTGGLLNATALNGPVNLYQSSGDMVLNRIMSKQDVSLAGRNNIIDGNVGDSIINVYGNNITFSSTLGSIGTSAEDLDLYLNYGSTGGLLNATALNGPVNLYQSSGDMALNRIMSKQDVSLAGRNNIIDGNVGDSIINVYGNNITFSSTLGSIGTSAEDLDLYLNYGSTGGLLNATALNGPVNLYQSSGDMALNRILSKQDVTLAGQDSIIDGNIGDGIINVYGHNIVFSSTLGSIGTPAEDLDLLLNYSSTGGLLNATALNGSVNLYQSSGDMALNRIMSKQDVTLAGRNSIIDGNVGDSVINVYGNDIALSSTLGSIGTPTEDLDLLLNYSSTGGLLNATALNGSVNLYQASGDMALNRIMSKQDVTLAGRNSIIDGNVGDSVINVYGNDIALSSTLGSIGTPTEDLDLFLNYGSTGGSLTSTALNSIINLQQRSGDLYLNTIQSNNDVTLNSVGGIYTNTTLPTINITGNNLNLSSPIGIGTVGNPIEVQAGGTVTGTSPATFIHEN